MVNLAGARNKHVPFVFDADAVEYDDDDAMKMQLKITMQL